MTDLDERSDLDQFALVACGSAKQDEPAPAKDLYSSTYFRKKRQYATQHCSDWRILSAKHGLVHPDTVLEPYDASLSPRHDSYIGDDEVRHWCQQVQASLTALATELPNPAAVELIVLAGEAYIDPIEPALIGGGWILRFPFRGCGGLPGQMRLLSDRLEADDQ